MNIRKSIFTLASFSFLLNNNMLLAMEPDSSFREKKLFKVESSFNLYGHTNKYTEIENSFEEEGSFDSSIDEENNDSPIEKIQELLKKLQPLVLHDKENDNLMKKYIDDNKHILDGIRYIVLNASDNTLSNIFSEIRYEIVSQFKTYHTFNELLFDMLSNEFKKEFIKRHSQSLSGESKNSFICDINDYLDKYNVDTELEHEISEIIPVFRFIKQDIVNELRLYRSFDKEKFNILSDKYKQKFVIDIFIKLKEFPSYDEEFFVNLICKNKEKFITPIRSILSDLYFISGPMKPILRNNIKQLLLCLSSSKDNLNKNNVNIFKHILRNIYK